MHGSLVRLHEPSTRKFLPRAIQRCGAAQQKAHTNRKARRFPGSTSSMIGRTTFDQVGFSDLTVSCATSTTAREAARDGYSAIDSALANCLR